MKRKPRLHDGTVLVQSHATQLTRHMQTNVLCTIQLTVLTVHHCSPFTVEAA